MCYLGKGNMALWDCVLIIENSTRALLRTYIHFHRLLIYMNILKGNYYSKKLILDQGTIMCISKKKTHTRQHFELDMGTTNSRLYHSNLQVLWLISCSLWITFWVLIWKILCSFLWTTSSCILRIRTIMRNTSQLCYNCWERIRPM